MRIRKLIGLLIAIVSSLNLYAATSAETLASASKALRSAKGISANFQLSNGGNVIKGTYKAKGEKFAMVSNAISIWFDGKNMWTYNRQSNETTLTVPTKQEIAESNPLSYIKNYTLNYTVTANKKSPKGKKSFNLTPKKTAKGYVPLEITIDESTLKPTQIKMMPKGTGSTVVSFSGVSYNATLNDAEFRYPSAKYKGVEVIDMR